MKDLLQERVKVAGQPRAYEAIIASGLLQHAGAHLQPVLTGRERLVVVTIPVVRRHWGKQLMASLADAGLKAKLIEMPEGERHKKLATVESLAEKLARAGANRDSVVVAFGGGVVGDVAGLLASVYMRGVDFVQIPTTLLAQVDASIGGKTGVNLRQGKNLVGTFHPPLAVLIDPEVLSTLSDRQFRSGLYEVLKMGVIGSPQLFDRFEEVNIQGLRRDHAELKWMIVEAVRLKAKIVSSDEKESGLRRVLNFGHTIGHALEASCGYRRFLHGEAVAWGMIAAAEIAVSLGKLNCGDAEKITAAVLGLGPLPKVNTEKERILRFLQTDKKTRQGSLHFILPRKIGRVEVVKDVPGPAIADAIARIKRLSQERGSVRHE